MIRNTFHTFVILRIKLIPVQDKQRAEKYNFAEVFHVSFLTIIAVADQGALDPYKHLFFYSSVE